jgi:cell division protein FtsZ
MLFDLPKVESPIIKVIGVGGGGSNAVNHMYKQGIIGVDFAICNTDSQAMELSPVPTRIHLGPNLTEGRGAGSKPNIGKLACEESIEDIRRYLDNNCRMLFITAGMGGGTGTGAAPIIAKTAQEMDILTVGIVTLPFTFEGRRRTDQGGDGLEELRKYVDTIIVVSNDKLRQIYGNLSLSEAFAQADNILTTAAKGIAEIITVPGYVNVDFEDVNTVMRNSGVAIMGTAAVGGDDRARKAVDEALHSPLLEDNDIRGAQHILLNISSGNREVTMDEIFEITEFVQEEAGYGTDLIWGNCYDESLGDKLSVTVIATGFNHTGGNKVAAQAQQGKIVVPLDDDDRRQQQPNTLKSISNTDADDKSTTEPRVFEFDNIRGKQPVNRIQRPVQADLSETVNTRDYELEERQKKLEREHKRREHLRNLNVKLTTPKNIVELENEPAYLRRGVSLDDVPHAEGYSISKWSITDDEPQIRENNQYLHKDVD